MDLDLRTEAEAFEYVTRNGWALELVPKDFRTEAVCLAACRNYGNAIWHVPDAVKTEAVWADGRNLL
ncbi:MAG: hypothetical protein K6E40_17510 [Desulfovibrio sp.]|nr:hypothetical protein [Desulfovibrio sp.]